MLPKLDKPVIMSLVCALASISAALSHHDEVYVELTGVRARISHTSRGKTWLEECLGDPEQLLDEIRMKPEAFKLLTDKLRSDGLASDYINALVEEKLLIFLYICA